MARAERRHRHVASWRETLPRESIYLAQTPQAFRRDVLRDALALGAAGVRRDRRGGAGRAAGHPVQLVEGEATNIKITTPEDLAIAEAIARGGRDEPARTGPGGHRLRPASARRGPAADSRRRHDSVRARRARALGRRRRLPRGHRRDSRRGRARRHRPHFPDTDPRWKDASSLDLLRRAVALVRERGLRGRQRRRDRDRSRRPKLAPSHRRDARVAGRRARHRRRSRVSIKGKTNEGVGRVGRGEAIAAHAVALSRADVMTPAHVRRHEASVQRRISRA